MDLHDGAAPSPAREHPPTAKRVAGAMTTYLRSETRILAGPWLGEVGWEVLYWIPLLRWCVHRWPELRERLVIVSRGGVSDWYQGVADTYFDVFEVFDERAFTARLEGDRAWRRTRGDRWCNQVDKTETEWEQEIARWVRETLDEPSMPTFHPSLLFRSLKLARGLPDEEGGFAPWRRPDRGRLEDVLPDRYVAVRFYESGTFSGADASAFAEAATRALAERLPVVALDPGVRTDPDHADFSSGADVISLAPHLSLETNLGTQSIAIANAEAFVGTFGGLSFLGPHYGIPSVGFWSVPGSSRGIRLHLDVASRAFSGPGWGRLTAGWLGDAPVEELLNPALAGSSLGSSR